MTKDTVFSLLSEADQALLGPVDKRSISPTLWRHAEAPRNMGTLPDPHGQGEVTGICEDTIAVQVKLDGDTVSEIRFTADGCGFTRAAASMATELSRGKSIANALAMTGGRIAAALDGLPRDHVHCADLAANGVKAAVRDALSQRREPWKPPRR